MRTCFVAFLVVVSCASVGAVGLIVPTAQDRSLSDTAFAEDAFSGPVSDSDSDQAADFGPFDPALSADVSVDTALASGGGQQSSTILDDTIQASGSIFANAEVWDFDTFADASSSNRVQVTFQLGAESDYTLQGELQAFDPRSVERNVNGSRD